MDVLVYGGSTASCGNTLLDGFSNCVDQGGGQSAHERVLHGDGVHLRLAIWPYKL